MFSYSSYLTLVDFIPDPLIITDSDGCIRAINSAAEAFLSIQRDTIIGQPLHNLQLDNEINFWLTDYILTPRNLSEYPYPIKQECDDIYVDKIPLHDINGDLRYFQLRARPLCDPGGQIVGTLQMIRDQMYFMDYTLESKYAQNQMEAAFEQLTAVEEELRQQFEELQYTTAIQRESERRFRTFLEGSQLVTTILDINMELLFINDYALNLTGWQRDEVLHKTYMDILFPAAHRDEVRKWVLDALSSPDPIHYGNVPLLTKDGAYRYIDWSSNKLYNGNGQLEGIAIIGVNVTDRVLAEREVRRQLDYTNTMINNLNEMFYTFDLDMRLTFINKKSREVLGYAPEEIIGTFFNPGQVDPEDWDWINAEIKHRFDTGQSSSYVLPWLHRDGHKIYLKINSSALYDGNKIIGGLVLADDITKDIQNADILRNSEKNLRRVTDNMLDLIAEVSMQGELVYVSPSHEKLLGYSCEEMRSMKFKDFVHLDDLPTVLKQRKICYLTGNSFTCQERCQHKNGSYIWLETLGNPVKDGDKVIAVVLSSRDITERKELENKLLYLGAHDILTGLYNRTFFETEIAKLEEENNLPVGIMICDLDGLKLINDTFGHLAGDDLLRITGKLLCSSFGQNDKVFRVGGDEFAIILPNADGQVLETCAHRVLEQIGHYNEQNPPIPLSISMGMAVCQKPAAELRNAYKEADNNMYRFKLNNSRSARSAVVQTLMKALEARDFITEGHGERIQKLVVTIGEELGLPYSVITTLGLFGQFHDIGKVGIADRILFKEGRLTPEEFEHMKQHCAIGHRIALASPELAGLAELILKHHEAWDGSGYPLGLSREEIPIECRILAIADAYDAMTSDRPYRKAMHHEAAIEELLRCKGTQFDPNLVDVFINILNKGT